MVKLLRSLVIFLAVVTVLVTTIFLIIIWQNFKFTGKGNISWENTAQVADFFGGVIGTLLSAMGFILIYLSFKSQTDSQNDQKNQFLQSQIETRFIELIKIHKETVSSLHYKREKELNGQRVIDFIVNQFESCFKEIAVFFEDTDKTHYYHPEMLENISRISTTRSISPIQMAHIDVAYSIVFFGLAKDDFLALRNLLRRQYNHQLVEDILQFTKLKSLDSTDLAKWKIIQKSNLSADNIRSIISKYKQDRTVTRTQFDNEYQEAFESLLSNTSTDKYYGGHQYKLGHYFRHLFMTVKYINEQQIIDYSAKYDYMKMLRAQISTIEQYLIFYNSLSFMGRAWELEHIRSDDGESDKNKWLFTKYNLIKNTPNLTPLEDIKLNTFYPGIHFEFNEAPAQREELIKVFK